MAERGDAASHTARREDSDAVADVLTHAFADDPVWRHLVPDDDRWLRGAPHFFRNAIRNALAENTLWVAGGTASAAV